MKAYDVAIIGGGAAGLMCAAEAGRRRRSVILLEHSREIGRKILISGGGRCNFTNVHCRPENFFGRNPHFVKSALSRFTPADFVRVVESHGIPYHEKKAGQLFCDRSARDVVEMLARECRSGHVRIETGAHISGIRQPGPLVVETGAGAIQASSVVVATGGLSIPKMGASGFGYEVAGQFGLSVEPCRPALVPLRFNRADRARYAGLAGVSAEVIASADGQSFRDKMLFTHAGLSGPAILQVSSFWGGRQPIEINLLPGVNFAEEWRTRGARTEMKTVLADRMPRRLAELWLEYYGDERPEVVAERLRHWAVFPAGDEGYEKAEVTAGGVSTDELSSKTMEARKVPGLFFIGEVVDVTGHLGGFNFQWAWASGWCAGQYV